MQKITPFFWFEQGGREAAEFYISVFGGDSKIKNESVMNDTPSGKVEILTVELFGQEFTFMTAGPFRKFNEAISFVVSCETQEEVDRYWEKLSADPSSEQCGWLKDKFGVTWQIVPTALQSYIGGPDKEGAARATQVMLKMKKLDIETLRRAYEGEA